MKSWPSLGWADKEKTRGHALLKQPRNEIFFFEQERQARLCAWKEGRKERCKEAESSVGAGQGRGTKGLGNQVQVLSQAEGTDAVEKKKTRR